MIQIKYLTQHQTVTAMSHTWLNSNEAREEKKKKGLALIKLTQA